jgi:hypothetical protein
MALNHLALLKKEQLQSAFFQLEALKLPYAQSGDLKLKKQILQLQEIILTLNDELRAIDRMPLFN